MVRLIYNFALLSYEIFNWEVEDDTCNNLRATEVENVEGLQVAGKRKKDEDIEFENIASGNESKDNIIIKEAEKEPSHWSSMHENYENLKKQG